MFFYSDNKQSDRKKVFLILVLLTLANVGVYWQVRDFDFTNFDDDVLIYDNELVRNGFSFDNVARAFTTMQDGAWMPITWLSHMLDCQVFGVVAGPHHLTNVFWHIINTILFFLVLKSISGSINRSAVAAALFALHPLHVETVAWVADRKDLLCMFFWLLTVLVYGSWVRRPDIWRYLLLLLFFAAALMAKAMAVTLPLVLLLLDYWPLKRFSSLASLASFKVLRQLVIEKIPLFVLAGASVVVAIMAETRIGMVVSLDRYSLPTRLANAVTSYIIYLFKTFWPFNLVPFYLYPSQITFLHWGGALLLLVSISCLVVRFSREYPYLSIGWLLYLITLMPVIGLVQLGAMARADRFTYLPLTGIIIVLVWGGERIARVLMIRWELVITAVITLLLAISFVSWRQVGYWRNSRTLFEHTLSVEPDNFHAEVILGVYSRDKGEFAEAISHLRRAIELAPGDHEAYATLGNVYDRMGLVAEAERYYMRAVQIEPTFVEVYDSLGAMKARQGDLMTAESYFRRSLGYFPLAPKAMVNLALVLYLRANFAEAETLFRRALELNPRFAPAWNGLGLLQSKQGLRREAEASFRAALNVDPSFIEATENLKILHGDKPE